MHHEYPFDQIHGTLRIELITTSLIVFVGACLYIYVLFVHLSVAFVGVPRLELFSKMITESLGAVDSLQNSVDVLCL